MLQLVSAPRVAFLVSHVSLSVSVPATHPLCGQTTSRWTHSKREVVVNSFFGKHVSSSGIQVCCLIATSLVTTVCGVWPTKLVTSKAGNHPQQLLVGMYVRICMYSTSTYIHMQCTYIHICVCVYIYLYLHYMCVCIYIYMYMCMCIYIYSTYVYMYTYVYVDVHACPLVGLEVAWIVMALPRRGSTPEPRPPT